MFHVWLRAPEFRIFIYLLFFFFVRFCLLYYERTYDNDDDYNDIIQVRACTNWYCCMNWSFHLHILHWIWLKLYLKIDYCARSIAAFFGFNYKPKQTNKQKRTKTRVYYVLSECTWLPFNGQKKEKLDNNVIVNGFDSLMAYFFAVFF